MEIIYRFNPEIAPAADPVTPVEAIERLEAGNEEFVRLNRATRESAEPQVIHHPPSFVDLSQLPGSVARQEPFAVVLGCSDARVPTEVIFNQPRNELFIVRVAGSVLGDECLGSIEYAAQHLAGTLRLVVVLGHTSCGAVTAAVDAFLDPERYPEIASSQALRGVIDRIFVSVRAAANTLEAVHGTDIAGRAGYRSALIETSVAFNTGLTAWTLRGELAPAVLERVGVVFGVLDMVSYEVWSAPSVGISPGLAAAPTGRQDFRELGDSIVDGDRIRTLLGD